MIVKAVTFIKAFWSLFMRGPNNHDVISLRLDECEKCEYRKGEHCGACGCPVWSGSKLGLKVIMPDLKCPQGRWVK